MHASYVSRALLECTHYKNNVHKGEISFAFMLLPVQRRYEIVVKYVFFARLVLAATIFFAKNWIYHFPLFALSLSALVCKAETLQIYIFFCKNLDLFAHYSLPALVPDQVARPERDPVVPAAVVQDVQRPGVVARVLTDVDYGADDLVLWWCGRRERIRKKSFRFGKRGTNFTSFCTLL